MVYSKVSTQLAVAFRATCCSYQNKWSLRAFAGLQPAMWDSYVILWLRQHNNINPLCFSCPPCPALSP